MAMSRSEQLRNHPWQFRSKMQGHCPIVSSWRHLAEQFGYTDTLIHWDLRPINLICKIATLLQPMAVANLSHELKVKRRTTRILPQLRALPRQPISPAQTVKTNARPGHSHSDSDSWMKTNVTDTDSQSSHPSQSLSPFNPPASIWHLLKWCLLYCSLFVSWVHASSTKTTRQSLPGNWQQGNQTCKCKQVAFPAKERLEPAESWSLIPMWGKAWRPLHAGTIGTPINVRCSSPSKYLSLSLATLNAFEAVADAAAADSADSATDVALAASASSSCWLNITQSFPFRRRAGANTPQTGTFAGFCKRLHIAEKARCTFGMPLYWSSQIFCVPPMVQLNRLPTMNYTQMHCTCMGPKKK